MIAPSSPNLKVWAPANSNEDRSPSPPLVAADGDVGEEAVTQLANPGRLDPEALEGLSPAARHIFATFSRPWTVPVMGTSGGR